MGNHLTRREFLKLLSLLPLSYLNQNLYSTTKPALKYQNKQNVLIILFDTLSANHISLYGYPRDTMPNLARLAEKATVYHNHYTAGSFTTPGTASLLTGTYSWSHRAFKLYDSVAESFVTKNIFSLFSANSYSSIAYTHNPLADVFLRQFINNIESYKPRQDLFLNNDYLLNNVLIDDFDIASISRERILKKDNWLNSSIILSRLIDLTIGKQYEDFEESYLHLFPRGIPKRGKDSPFLLEDSINWMLNQLEALPQPFLGYFHFLPPHDPYNTRHDFIDKFNDNWVPEKKPQHPFSRNLFSRRGLLNQRQWYDEYIAYIDAEFGRLFDHLESNGILEDTWLIFTSDHGELLERGMKGHLMGALYQPLIKIPLLIFQPNQISQRNIYESTASIDLFPTLLHVTNQTIPSWLEGVILPPYSPNKPDPKRSIFSIRVRDQNPKYAPIQIGTIVLINNRYKLIHYIGYKKYPGFENKFELYDIVNDPEELTDLYPSNLPIATHLKNELLAKLDEVNAPYQN